MNDEEFDKFREEYNQEPRKNIRKKNEKVRELSKRKVDHPCKISIAYRFAPNSNPATKLILTDFIYFSYDMYIV